MEYVLCAGEHTAGRMQIQSNACKQQVFWAHNSLVTYSYKRPKLKIFEVIKLIIAVNCTLAAVTLIPCNMQ